MTRTEPAAGDFVVEYIDATQRPDEVRVVIVHLMSDVGLVEVYWSRLPQAGAHAERLAATWALEDGTCAWRLLAAGTAEASLTGLTTDVVPAPNVIAVSQVHGLSRSPW